MPDKRTYKRLRWPVGAQVSYDEWRAFEQYAKASGKSKSQLVRSALRLLMDGGHTTPTKRGAPQDTEPVRFTVILTPDGHFRACFCNREASVVFMRECEGQRGVGTGYIRPACLRASPEDELPGHAATLAEAWHGVNR